MVTNQQFDLKPLATLFGANAFKDRRCHLLSSAKLHFVAAVTHFQTVCPGSAAAAVSTRLCSTIVWSGDESN
jgi:hypothetical protein